MPLVGVELLLVAVCGFPGRQLPEQLDPFLGLLPSPWRHPAAVRTFLCVHKCQILFSSPKYYISNIYSARFTCVADHLAHLYEDAVHAGGQRPAGHRLLAEQVVGDGDTVAEARVVVLLVPVLTNQRRPSGHVTSCPPITAHLASAAEVLHPTAHGCQHQQRDETWEISYILILI